MSWEKCFAIKRWIILTAFLCTSEYFVGFVIGGVSRIFFASESQSGYAEQSRWTALEHGNPSSSPGRRVSKAVERVRRLSLRNRSTSVVLSWPLSDSYLTRAIMIADTTVTVRSPSNFLPELVDRTRFGLNDDWTKSVSSCRIWNKLHPRFGSRRVYDGFNRPRFIDKVPERSSSSMSVRVDAPFDTTSTSRWIFRFISVHLSRVVSRTK